MDKQAKDENVQKSKEIVKRTTGPIENLQKILESGKCKITDFEAKLFSKALLDGDVTHVSMEHDGDEFYVFCSCDGCMKYRTIILVLMKDHFIIRSFWDILRRNITKCYKPIIENASEKVKSEYDLLLAKNSHYSWLTSGTYDKMKMEHMKFISELSFTESVVLILFTALFMVYDAHQLLELLSFQVECFAKAYAVGLSEKIALLYERNTTMEDVMTYLLNGYKEICKVAKRMSQFLFSFEINHMKQFGLDWIVLNKRMYQRFVYADYVNTMAKWIIELKSEVSPERYSELVKDYIEFDEEMTLINLKWRHIWTALHAYNLTQQDQGRRKFLKKANNVYDVIRHDDVVPFVQFIDIPNWDTHQDKQLVWQNVVAYIKRKWPVPDKVRINATATAAACKKCKSNYQAFHKESCSCATCLIAGEPILPSFSGDCGRESGCVKCSLTEKVTKNGAGSVNKTLPENDANEQNSSECSVDNKSSSNNIKTYDTEKDALGTELNLSQPESEVYHLDWVVFKRIRGRKQYPYQTIEEKYFCSNCTRLSCLLAKKIINREVTYYLTNHLKSYYQPFTITTEELAEIIPCLFMYNHKALSVMYNPSYDDLVMITLWTFISSAAANFFVADNVDTSKPRLDQLKLVNNDIVLPSQYPDKTVQAKKFVDFFGKKLGILECEENNYRLVTPTSLKEALLKEMNQLNTTDNARKQIDERAKKKPYEVYKDEPLNIKYEPELIKPREVPEPPKPKTPSCCPDQHCKETHMPKTCGHEKDFHSRVNETRDRLRKKLSELTSAKKNAKIISKTVGKSPLDLIKVLNHNPPTLKNLSKNILKAQAKSNIVKLPTKETMGKAIGKVIQEKDIKIKTTVLKEPKCTNIPVQVQTDPVDKTENLDEWVKDTLSFIEGGGDNKKPKFAVNNKKAAKKAKQKMKKEEQKRIEELHDFRSQFHDLYFKEYLSKNELKTQKLSKKKDKKRIGELEANIKKLSKAKSKIETCILELIATVKSTSSDFKFSYLPTKEQQQEALLKNSSPTAPIVPIPVSNEQNKCGNTKTIYYPTEPQFVPPSEFRSPPKQKVQIIATSQPGDESLDASKRIVTIRRVNLPNVNEPQVTVTAKGASPDKDKLLYTFINGQLVPATSLDAQTLSVLQPTVFPTQLKNSALEEINVPKTKTQLKKERKKAKKLEAETQKRVEAEKQKRIEELKMKKEQIRASGDNVNSKKQVKNVKNTAVELVNSGNKDKGDLKKSQSKCSSADSGINSREHSVGNGKSGTSNGSSKIYGKNQLEKVKTSEKTPTNSIERKQDRKRKKVVDKGQFDNNQFKMLHMDELSYESEESTERIKIEQNKISQTRVIKNNQNQKDSKKNQSNAENKEKVLKETTDNGIVQKKKKKKKKTVEPEKPIQQINSDSNLESKKQKKQSKKKQNNKVTEVKTNQPSVEKVVKHPDNTVKSLRHSMQRLRINSDTTLELLQDSNGENGASVSNANISIMEQLNRGVQVEDLALPPGITLTKVDPSRIEAIKARTESIGKLSQPMQQQCPPNNMIPPTMSPGFMPHLGRYGSDQSGVIMVEAMGSRGSSHVPNINDTKPSKKNKRRSKKKKNENAVNASQHPEKKGEPKMITLRNPMFHGQPMHNHILPMSNRSPIAPLPMDQPAAIIKNENGMFTIRNPALHQAFSANLQNNYRACNPNLYNATSSAENSRNYSYFSENLPNNGTQYSNGNPEPKRISAIGSEIKNAQQQKKTAQQWPLHDGGCSSQSNCCYLPETNNSSVTMQQKYQQSNYCNNFDAFMSNSGNLFNNPSQNTHNCDESPPPTVSGFNHYLDDIPNQGGNNSKYDDMSFFRNLIPGQRLNSEVTIHNINESKFSANNSSSHQVEITPISRPTSRTNDFSPSLESMHRKNFTNSLSEYENKLFASSDRMMNLTDLKSDAEGESFNRYRYAFESLKEDIKPNINPNDLLTNSKKSTNRQTPFIDDTAMENFVQNLNSLEISPENVVNGNNQEYNDRNNWW